MVSPRATSRFVLHEVFGTTANPQSATIYREKHRRHLLGRLYLLEMSESAEDQQGHLLRRLLPADCSIYSFDQQALYEQCCMGHAGSMTDMQGLCCISHSCFESRVCAAGRWPDIRWPDGDQEGRYSLICVCRGAVWRSRKHG